MSDFESVPDQEPSESQHDLIERACDRFIAAVRDGGRPQIEEFVGLFPQINRQALVERLITLEVELQGTKDETITFDAGPKRPSLDGYYQRFPEASPILNDLQKKWEQSLANLPDVELPPTSDLGSPAAPVNRPARPLPRRIKQFELREVLGQGGFGIVWRARDERLQRDVAHKLPRSDRLSVFNKEMFLEEARAAATLRHPNIVAIYEVSEHEAEVYIVSELVDGVNLKVWSQSRPLSPADAAGLIAKLAKAVQHAHDQGIVHRDLKPANVLIDKQGEPHIADFGLAKRDSNRGTSPGSSGQLLGTPAYMAPEQARGDEGAIGPHTDVYALGAMFYELLTAVRPFHGDTAVLLEQVQHTPPKSPRLIKPDIPRELEAICLKCLAKDSAHRYESAQALADDLYRYLAGETVRGVHVALPTRLRNWFRRHRRVASAMALTFCIALLVAGSITWQFRGTKPIPADVREVRFVTEPAGCEITAVGLDRLTGEPDPTKIHHAKGRTPLIMQLPPGDYLIVAVLDDNRFNEVYRHVPAKDETISQANRHLNWGRDPAGVINVPKFRIPRSGVENSMRLVNGTDRLVEPKNGKAESSQSWRIPSFYVDSNEMTAQDVENWGIEAHGAERWAEHKRSRNYTPEPGPLLKMNYSIALARLESRGKRLPSAAELFYLSTVVCPKSPAPGNDAAGDSPCVLPDGSQIEGLHAGVWEWTTTRLGGHLVEV
ncbi:MAG: Serine/threonine protein kinase PrkC, regulator of stationary phase [Planctomycetaceae bacterium]|nr:Serine/threonine protein kinase PrkC, regulator of stationary phase [Planctomycetaceae bacterium]